MAKFTNASATHCFPDFAELERLQLKQWVALSTAAKIDFFEEMIQLAYLSGALRPERLALRDQECERRGETDSSGSGND